ncbi:MAG: lipopolysaccharide biosynthesis protein [Bacteroidetes bacterium]|nr:lipopolysaccharide biosynthesis protein [Bacteroidota bacterium]MDA0903144.1 lipopolysaccharide biosynthesis protein [Bacteroidota bacterium]MDA1242391.1 lipopolysaccharide biosynthesis protein [Bacteroidota bacterium]
MGVSLSWQTLNVMLQVGLQLIYMALLARWIAPEDFGVMAIALVVVGVVEIFAQVGIGPSIVQQPHLTPSHIATAWWFSAGLGLVFFAGMYLAAPALSAHYETPALCQVLRWISLSFVISGFSVVSRSLLIKRMDFRALTACALAGMVVGNLGIGLWMASQGAGLWAYVTALLVQNGVLSLGYVWFARIPLHARWDGAALGSLLTYGGRSTVFNLLTYAGAKVDMLMVKESLGWRDVGWYDRAVYLMGLPVTVLGKLGDSVLFSGLSAMQDNRDQLRATSLRGLHLISLLTLPMTIVLVWQAEGITRLILGPKFDGAAPLAQTLFLAVALRALTKLGDANIRALDGLRWGITIKLVFLGTLAVGVQWALTRGHGSQGAAWAVVAASGVQWLLTMGWMTQTLGISWPELLRFVRPGIGMAIAVAIPMGAIPSSAWWVSTAIAVCLAVCAALVFPGLALPKAVDPQGTLRSWVAARLPMRGLRSRWES